MEFPTLGKNCMRADCNVLDFLPIKCQYCGDFFCSKHFLPTDHSCKVYDAASSKPSGIIVLYKRQVSLQMCGTMQIGPVGPSPSYG